MARGKHAEKSVRQTIDKLRAELDESNGLLAITADELAKVRKELKRFRALENVFDENSDVLRQLNEARNAVEVLSTENELYREKLKHYLEVMSAEDNLKFSREILGDMADFGLMEKEFKGGREHRRRARNRNSLIKGLNENKQIEEFGRSRGVNVGGK
jgi:GTP1/Obg family GTP-binding protein